MCKSVFKKNFCLNFGQDFYNLCKYLTSRITAKIFVLYVVRNDYKSLIKFFIQKKNYFKVRVEKRMNEVVNRLNKTKVTEDQVDLQAQRQERDSEENRKLV